jgi:hypothetical protein
MNIDDQMRIVLLLAAQLEMLRCKLLESRTKSLVGQSMGHRGGDANNDMVAGQVPGKKQAIHGPLGQAEPRDMGTRKR